MIGIAEGADGGRERGCSVEGGDENGMYTEGVLLLTEAQTNEFQAEVDSFGTESSDEYSMLVTTAGPSFVRKRSLISPGNSHLENLAYL